MGCQRRVALPTQTKIILELSIIVALIVINCLYFLPRARAVFLSHIRSNDLLRRTFRAFGAPANFNLWGERRQPSPNDVGVILCDRLAERERNSC